jgi:diguanylate cyclase (GGDEF)-like protein
VLRFVTVTAVGLLVAGAGIVAIVNHAFAREAQRQANEHAQLAVTTMAAGELRRMDFRSGLTAARRQHLRRQVPAALGDGVAAQLYSPDGRLTLSVPAAGLASAGTRPALVDRALEGNIVSNIASTPTGRVLSTYVPVRGERGRAVGVVRLDRDYDPIAAAALRSSIVVAGVLEGLLVMLCVLLVPMLSRSAARLRRHVDELDHVATHDDLTGLPNRLGFQRALDAAIRTDGGGAALLVFDLDEFHEINNALGASGGDALLVEVAERLQAYAGDGVVGRVGEDEFAILLDTRDAERVSERATDLGHSFARPMSVKGVRIAIDPHVGAALIPDHGPGLDQILRRAGIALAAAKEDRAMLRIFDPSDDVADRSRLELTAELREAITTGQLVVHYQPQADLTTRAIRGIEALVRWEHPTHGTLMPDAFIPLAERNGLITQVDRYVLRQALADWETLQSQGVVIDLAVNLSPLDLLDAEFASQLDELLRRHRLPPQHLVLEITERTLVRDDRRTHDGLHRLAATGARLSIDDFGTGYSSLAYLYKLPIRQVKLDRTFIANVPHDPSSDAIVRATVELAHTLNATVVAEGVETQEQWAHLETLRCDIAQGFFIGEARPATDVIELLTRHPGEPVLVAA